VQGLFALTTHPAKAAGCNKSQVDAFDRIAAGDARHANPASVDVLIRKGLLVDGRRIDLLGKPIGKRSLSIPADLLEQWTDYVIENMSDEEFEKAVVYLNAAAQ
jgi:hypothetical protein